MEKKVLGKKNILVIGGGGREHAVIWKLRQSEKVGKIYAIPGNGGISTIAECHKDIKATDIDKILEFVKTHEDIYLTVVTPDDPLSLGLVNQLEKLGKRAFGPTKEAAIVEYSKAFSKDFMKRNGIPTAAYETFTSYEQALKYLETCTYPIVIKADGLALGKGVIICNDFSLADKALREMMLDKSFGTAGDRVVIEEFLTGYEVSFLAFTDGETLYPALPARDYKRAMDGNLGLNTGGMGSFCPVLEFDKKLQDKAIQTIMLPTIRALMEEGRRFKGVLYFGLMVSGDDIRVIEYNARFGDPETQVILPMLKSDLFDIFDAIIDQKLAKIDIEWRDGASVCVIAASGGYPLAYEKGKEIDFGTDSVSGASTNDGASSNDLDIGGQNTMIFHAGTKRADGKYFTSGGRVLGVTAIAENLENARKTAYKRIETITFDKMFYRKDICKK